MSELVLYGTILLAKQFLGTVLDIEVNPFDMNLRAEVLHSVGRKTKAEK